MKKNLLIKTTGKIQLPLKTLKEKYTINPFSIFRADTGEWIKHKREWESILQDRANNVRDLGVRNNTPYINNFEKEDFKGAKSPNAGMISTFDPFLCEILIKWFTDEDAVILDPFAGGIVRGAVSSILNRKYIGIDINEKQIAHNKEQWTELSEKYAVDKSPQYILGDSEEVLHTVKIDDCDLVLSCPPYYNLERYTKELEDLSNKSSYADFINKYKCVLDCCYKRLKPEGFMILVVEEIRDTKGVFYGFVPDTIKICQEIGLSYYNECILMNPIASLGIRCTKYFESSRKIGRHHQNILIFKK